MSVTRSIRNDDVWQRIVDAAKLHGEESEPDQEVGDLQRALYVAIAQLRPAQCATVVVSLQEHGMLVDED